MEQDSKGFTFACVAIRLKGKGLLVDDGEREIWLPLSECEIKASEAVLAGTRHGARVPTEITIPEWLAREKRLIASRDNQTGDLF